jgi:hypothetical protein
MLLRVVGQMARRAGTGSGAAARAPCCVAGGVDGSVCCDGFQLCVAVRGLQPSGRHYGPDAPAPPREQLGLWHGVRVDL